MLDLPLAKPNFPLKYDQLLCASVCSTQKPLLLYKINGSMFDDKTLGGFSLHVCVQMQTPQM